MRINEKIIKEMVLDEEEMKKLFLLLYGFLSTGDTQTLGLDSISVVLQNEYEIHGDPRIRLKTESLKSVIDSVKKTK